MRTESLNVIAAKQILAGVFAVLVSLLLVACGSSRVVREGGLPQAGASTPKSGGTVTVRRGDTLYRIARNHDLNPFDLAKWNGIRSPYTIYPGQRLRLYPSGSAGAGGTATTTTTAQPSAGAGTAAPEQSAASASPAPATSSVAWRWPVEGEIASRYAAGDPTRQGISIAGNGGQEVRAAADGVVVYSGSGLVGYGELIIVKHDEDWLSAYGHNRARLVNEGAQVRSGQQIAEMGRSGADGDMLHFEIRYQGKPVDPLRYLPQR